MKNSFILFLFIALALSGCRKEIKNYEHPDFDPQPTLNAVLQEGKSVWAQITLAQCLDSVHPAPCTDAEVLLYVDGQFAEKLQHRGKGLYLGETRAEAFHEYACKVIVPGFDTLYASTEMPTSPRVFDIKVLEKALVNDEGQVCPAFLITFGNNPNQKQYFSASLDILMKWKDENKGNRDWIDGYYVNSSTLSYSYQADDPVLLNEGSEMLVFSNEIIRDTSYSLKVNNDYGPRDHSTALLGYVVAHMSGLSASAYHYIKSQNALNEPDAFTNLFLGVITPINLYSNVENGRGVFAAIAPMTCDTIFINPENRN